MQNKRIYDLPDWMIPDQETVERDATSATDSYLIEVREATYHQYKNLIKNPQHHIYNLFGAGGFVDGLKSAYSHFNESERLKAEAFDTNSSVLDCPTEDKFWSNAPLQWVARRVGERALPGLHAIALITQDWKPYQKFLNWFLSEWLPKADETAEKYYRTPRYISRTFPMHHEISPHLDWMRDFTIKTTNDLFYEYPETLKTFNPVSLVDFAES